MTDSINQSTALEINRAVNFLETEPDFDIFSQPGDTGDNLQ